MGNPASCRLVDRILLLLLPGLIRPDNGYLISVPRCEITKCVILHLGITLHPGPDSAIMLSQLCSESNFLGYSLSNFAQIAISWIQPRIQVKRKILDA